MDSYSDSSSSADAEDTALYQELTRQILMLTDEDDDRYTVEPRRRPVVHGGVGSRPVARNYYSWSESVRSPVPGWMESLWANGGGGTGVFIPSGVAVAAYSGGGKKFGRRRRNNKVRKNNDRGGGQKIHG
ncbi:unnamed protein product [Lactuca virosa]|uniref:Uncharacterized protein n=1 Tax=Lactuca virosa TaxID=75947 RepID=A0AAU9MXN3_9ASTR|nr:unnamed protein product [Lactuca virosa]